MIKKYMWIALTIITLGFGLVGCQTGNNQSSPSSSQENTASGPLQVDEDLDLEEEVSEDQGFGGQ